MNDRPRLFVAPALAAAAVCLLLCGTIHRAGARTWTPTLAIEGGIQRYVAQLAAEERFEEDLVGKKMPPLHFDRWVNTPGNKPLEMVGKVTLYRWWTDGCPHCEKTLPAVEALRKRYGEKLQVVAVYHPKPPRAVKDADVKAAAAAIGYDGAIAVDLDWSELRKFYLDTAPRSATSASFLVDGEGVIRFVHPGPRFYPSQDPAEAKENDDYRRLEAAVKDLCGSDL